VRFGDQPEEGTVSVEAPRATLFNHFQARFIVTIKDLLGNTAGGCTIDEGKGVRSMPLDANNCDGAI